MTCSSKAKPRARKRSFARTQYGQVDVVHSSIFMFSLESTISRAS
jgi:hypothetical protein